MDKSQIDAIAHTILEPGLRAQEDVRQKRAAEAAYLASKRRSAWFALAGAAAGATLTYLNGAGFSLGVLWGAIAGYAAGWLITLKRPNQSSKQT